MYLHSLQAEDFRNLSSLNLAFAPAPAVIWGENGQGKSNLLEAASLACTGRLWRAARDEEAICWGEKIARVKAKVHRARSDPLTTEIALLAEGAGLFKINGVTRRRSDLTGLVPVVAFSSEDIQIIKGDPSRRRRFLNEELSQMSRSYRWNLLHFGRALEQRNRLLKEAAASGAEKASLPPWEEAMARYGARVMEKRAKFLHELEKTAGKHLAELHSGWGALRLLYRPALGNAQPEQSSEMVLEKTSEELENLLTEVFQRSREEEIARGFSLVGPQRDDFDLLIKEIDQRTFGSQGQQRSLAIAFRLALTEMLEENLGESPILLLDDIFSELDAGRRRGLLQALCHQEQFLLTTSSLEETPAPLLEKARVYHIHGGQAKPMRSA